MSTKKYKRVVLKLSGESLAGEQGFGINPAGVEDIAAQIQAVREEGIDCAVVVGGGNIWRGLAGSAKGMDRATADYMGMLATVMNCLALQDALEKRGVDSRVQSAIDMRQVAEPYIRRKAIRHMEKGRVVIFAAGTGNPYFSTDTTAALRAAEIGAEVILLAKKIDAVYSDDPETNPNAERYDALTHTQVLEQDLKVMDATAAALCRDNDIAIHVFALAEEGNVMKAVCGEKIGTIVSGR